MSWKVDLSAAVVTVDRTDIGKRSLRRSDGRQPTHSNHSVILLILLSEVYELQVFPRNTVARIPGVPVPIWMCFASVNMARSALAFLVTFPDLW
jgi:hypothetical protein